MKRRAIVWSLCIVALVVWTGLAYAQTAQPTVMKGQTGAGGPDKIKSMLLQPTGWRAHWRGPAGNTGFSDYLFEAREEKLVAKIQLASHPYHQGMSCERDVTILPDGVKLDSCLDRDITLLFDPNDHEYPFKGKSPRDYEYKFKAK